MSTNRAPAADDASGGRATLRTPIVAEVSPSGEVALSCTSCGHEFLVGKPFTDTTEPVDNITLANMLWRHMCTVRSPEANRRQRHGG